MALGAILGGAGAGAVVSIVINAVDNASSVFKNVDTNLLAMGGAITAAGAVGAGVIGSFVKVAGEFEQTNIAFTTMLGSAEDAKKLLQELADFAAKTPFTITGVEQNAKQLLAMGIDVDDLLPTLKSLGDISAGLNVPLDRLALNFGQVAIQGKLTGRELRDFAVAGVPLVAELSKNLGVSEAAIGEMVSAGEIGFDDVEKAFQTMTGEGGKFYDLMDAQSETFLGQVSNIQDSFIKLQRTMGEVFLPTAKVIAEKLGVIIAWMEKHPTLIKWGAALLAIGTALFLIGGPLAIIIALLPAFAAGLGLIATGFAAVTAAGLPIWAIILGIGLAIAALIAIAVLLYKYWDKMAWWMKLIAFLFFPMITAGVFLIKNWDKIKEAAKRLANLVKNAFIGQYNIVMKVWNGIVNHVETSINKIIDIINIFIKLLNKIPNVNIDTIGNVDFGNVKGSMMDYEKYTPSVPDSSTNGEALTVVNVNDNNIYGTDPDEIADAIQLKVEDTIRLN